MNTRTKKALTGLRKAQTVLSNVIAMVEAGNDIPETVQQSLAVSGLLKSVNYNLLAAHVAETVSDLSEKKKKRTKTVESLIEDITAIVKLSQKK